MTGRTTLEDKEHRAAYSKHRHCKNKTMNQISDLEEVILDSLGPQSPAAFWRLRNGLREWHKTNFILSLPDKSGIRKSSRKQRVSKSPVNLTSNPPGKKDMDADRARDPYTFDFGEHHSKTIEEVMRDDPLYLVRYCLDRLNLRSRPNLTKALCALPNAALDRYPELEPMRYSRHDLFQASTGRHMDLDKVERFWSPIPWDHVLEKNKGPEPTLPEVKSKLPFEDHSFVVSFTGIMVRNVANSAEFVAYSPMEYMIAPCGWPRHVTVSAKFKGYPSGDFDLDLRETMLYKTFQVSGVFADAPGPLSWESFRPFDDPQPADLEQGVLANITGKVICVRLMSGVPGKCLEVQVKSKGRVLRMLVQDNYADIMPDESVYSFIGLMQPSECNGDIGEAVLSVQRWGKTTIKNCERSSPQVPY
jgi:hypothetical protein